MPKEEGETEEETVMLNKERRTEVNDWHDALEKAMRDPSRPGSACYVHVTCLRRKTKACAKPVVMLHL